MQHLKEIQSGGSKESLLIMSKARTCLAPSPMTYVHFTPKKKGFVYLFGILMLPTSGHVLRVNFHVDRQILVGIRTNAFKCRGNLVG